MSEHSHDAALQAKTPEAARLDYKMNKRYRAKLRTTYRKVIQHETHDIPETTVETHT